MDALERRASFQNQLTLDRQNKADLRANNKPEQRACDKVIVASLLLITAGIQGRSGRALFLTGHGNELSYVLGVAS